MAAGCVQESIDGQDKAKRGGKPDRQRSRCSSRGDDGARGSRRIGTGIDECHSRSRQGPVYYDAPPKPYWWLPVLRTEGQGLGLSRGQDSFRVCKSIRVRTWNHRNLWVRIKINDTDAWLNPRDIRLEEFLNWLDRLRRRAGR